MKKSRTRKRIDDVERRDKKIMVKSIEMKVARTELDENKSNT